MTFDYAAYSPVPPHNLIRTVNHGERLEDWKKEITDLKLAASLWDAVSARDERGLASLTEKLRRTQTPLTVRRQLYLRDTDPVCSDSSQSW